MSSILVYGGTNSNRKAKIEEILTKELNLKLSENNPDLVYVIPEKDKKSIGISVVKDIAKYISEKPMSNKIKAVVIENGDILTEQAQNSLLKVLEEHPAYCHFLIGAKNENSLIETVLSRCKKINLSNFANQNKNDKEIKEKTEKKFTDIGNLINKPIGERLVWAIEETELEREEVIEDLENMISSIRNSFKSEDNISNSDKVNRIELIQKVKKDLEDTNVTLKLALEYIAVKL